MLAVGALSVLIYLVWYTMQSVLKRFKLFWDTSVKNDRCTVKSHAL